MRKRDPGSIIVIVLVVGTALGFLIFGIANMLRSFSQNVLYFNAMSSAARLAETAANRAMGKLTLDPSAYLNASFSVPLINGNEQSHVEVFRRSFDNVNNGYLIVSHATKTLAGIPFYVELYNYVDISNVADYFAAIKEDLRVSMHTDVGLGKIYAKYLGFETDPDPPPIFVKRAEYVYSCDPDPPWSLLTKSQIAITEPATNEPVKLAYPLSFPQVLESDMEYYRGLAHINLSDLSEGHHRCTLSGDIFPPGYADPIDILDTYSGHTTDNKDHVYYCTGTMSLQGIVHGQVLFVAGEKIRITDDLKSADLTTTADFNGATLPGAGSDPSVNAGSSTAHQAILITRGSVLIDTTSIAAQHLPFPPAVPLTINLQCLVLAPNGSIQSSGTDLISPLISSKLKLDFTGSMILSETPGLSGVFKAGVGARTYRYMLTLATYPPPYLPYLTDVYYSFER